MHAGRHPAALEPCPFCVISADRVTLETEDALAFGDGQPARNPGGYVASIFDLDRVKSCDAVGVGAD